MVKYCIPWESKGGLPDTSKDRFEESKQQVNYCILWWVNLSNVPAAGRSLYTFRRNGGDKRHDQMLLTTCPKSFHDHYIMWPWLDWPSTLHLYPANHITSDHSQSQLRHCPINHYLHPCFIINQEAQSLIGYMLSLQKSIDQYTDKWYNTVMAVDEQYQSSK